jgi:predicted GH43/DUF377 family glycosyl hydrolase
MRVIVNGVEPVIEVERLGMALAPSRGELDVEGVLNPACVRNRDGRLVLYPRMVAAGNVSRIGIFEQQLDGEFRWHGIALEATMPYEFRTETTGHGCEDPRVTFLEALDLFLMAYTAFGPDGPKIALATSPDAYTWTRHGLLDFSRTEFDGCYDKDAAFFPEPVFSPDGVESLAFYHRPAYEKGGSLREDIWLAYIPLEPIRSDFANILKVESTVCLLEAGGPWGHIKVGGGTPPIRTPLGWLSIYHGVDRIAGETFTKTGLTYRAGLIIHDAQSPHYIRYVSPEPILSPIDDAERFGVVDSVVFPTAIDTFDMPAGTAVFYYGMADARIGAARLRFSLASPASAT